MRIRKTIITATALATAAVGMGQPAGAAAQEYRVEASHTSSGGTLTQSATARVLKTEGTKVTLQLDCLARTLPPAAGTGLPQCYFIGTSGTRRDALQIGALPGPVAHRSAIFDVPKQHYRVCVQANALFPSATTNFLAPLNCSA